MNGIATLRPADDARVFVTSLTFRTVDARYGWLNTLFGVLEGVLDTVALTARGRAYVASQPSEAPNPARATSHNAYGPPACVVRGATLAG